jgi:predicted RNA-binding protein with TRAM domain
MRYGRQRGRDSGPGRFPPKPVELGKEYDVEILELSRRGEGITRIKGLVCFVPNTKPGDKVRIKITRISRRFAEAEAVGEAEEKPAEAEAQPPPAESEVEAAAAEAEAQPPPAESEVEAAAEAEEKPAEAEAQPPPAESEAETQEIE